MCKTPAPALKFLSLAFSPGALLWHTCTHGKQRQRQERSEEGAQAQTQTSTQPEARRVHAGPAEIEFARPAAGARSQRREACAGGEDCALGPPGSTRPATAFLRLEARADLSASASLSPASFCRKPGLYLNFIVVEKRRLESRAAGGFHFRSRETSAEQGGFRAFPAKAPCTASKAARKRQNRSISHHPGTYPWFPARSTSPQM